MTSNEESVTLLQSFVSIRATWWHLPKHNCKNNTQCRDISLVWNRIGLEWISTITN